jgi:hypothetical protein
MFYIDIYVPCQNKCIEVKSLYTFNDNKIVNLLKKEAAEKWDIILNFGYTIIKEIKLVTINALVKCVSIRIFFSLEG